MATIGYRQYPPDHPKATTPPRPRKGLRFSSYGAGTGRYDIEFDGQVLGGLQSERALLSYSTYRGSQWRVSWGAIVPDGRGHRTHVHNARDYAAAVAFVRSNIEQIRAGEPVEGSQ
jgi:hypothetical protein